MFSYYKFMKIINHYKSILSDDKYLNILNSNLENVFNEIVELIEETQNPIIEENKKLNIENQSLKAKMLVYEEMIKKSNFAPVIEKEESDVNENNNI